MFSYLRRRPLTSFFLLAYGIAWLGSFAAAGPEFLRGETLSMTDVLLMFLAMLAGPSLAGLGLTYITGGRSGLRHLFGRMGRGRVGGRWYLALLIFPVLFLGVLLALGTLASPTFLPRFFPAGLAAGFLAGFFEEIGWTGFAFPRMERKYGALVAALLLGVLHALWHAAADFLGSAQTYGALWLPHFLIFMVATMTAVRVLIGWVYVHTRSLLLAQLMHVSSTGALAVFGPALGAREDMVVYGVYAAVLWGVVFLLVRRFGYGLNVVAPKNTFF